MSHMGANSLRNGAFRQAVSESPVLGHSTKAQSSASVGSGLSRTAHPQEGTVSPDVLSEATRVGGRSALSFQLADKVTSRLTRIEPALGDRSALRNEGPRQCSSVRSLH